MKLSNKLIILFFSISAIPIAVITSISFDVLANELILKKQQSADEISVLMNHKKSRCI